jgi:hypothetical protein
MRIIITGGTGLIGAALAQQLLQDQHEVIILTRNPARASGAPTGAKLQHWDGRTANGWSDLADGAEAIVNLAGESIAGANPIVGRWNAARKQAIRDSRLNAGQAIVEAVEKAAKKPRMLIQSSAVGYYGPRGPEEVTEDTPAGNDFLAQVCVDWEASTAAVEKHGVKRAIIRTGIVLSPQGGALVPLKLAFSLFAGGPMGNGQQYWPWLHLADEIAAIRFLIEQNAAGVFNLSAPTPLTNAEFARGLGQVMKRPSFMPTPAFALKIAMGELAEALLLNGQRMMPRNLLKLGYKFRFTELAPALTDLLG